MAERDNTGAAPGVSEKPSIAVLPFQNMSGDPEQEYFSDGITEDLITALSRVRQLHVVARNSTFSYKGQSPDIRKVSKELDTRYVIEGSVRRAGNRIRVTAQLIDGASGKHIWAERYDGELTEIFELQDAITRMVIGSVAPEVSRAEYLRVKQKPPENMDAWECYHCGMLLWQTYKKEEADKALELFERAMELDPNFSPAFSGYAVAYGHGVRIGFFEKDLYEKASSIARKAVELDDEDAWAHIGLGLLAHSNRDLDAAISEYEYAVELNPSLATAHSYLGRALSCCGRAEEGLSHIDEAIRLSPRDPGSAHFHAGKARAYLCLRQHEEAVEQARQGLRHQNVQWPLYATLASALAHLGRMDEARRARQQMEKLRPGLKIEFVRERLPITDADYMDHMVEGLRIAGLPE